MAYVRSEPESQFAGITTAMANWEPIQPVHVDNMRVLQREALAVDVARFFRSTESTTTTQPNVPCRTSSECASASDLAYGRYYSPVEADRQSDGQMVSAAQIRVDPARANVSAEDGKREQDAVDATDTGVEHANGTHDKSRKVVSTATDVLEAVEVLTKLSSSLKNASKVLSVAKGTAKIYKGVATYDDGSLRAAVEAIEGTMGIAAVFSSTLKTVKQGYSFGKGAAKASFAYTELKAYMAFQRESADLAQSVVNFATGVAEMIPELGPKGDAAKYAMARAIAFVHQCDNRATELGVFHDADGRSQTAWIWAADQGIKFQVWIGELTEKNDLAHALGAVATLLAGMYAGGRAVIETEREVVASSSKTLARAQRKLRYAGLSAQPIASPYGLVSALVVQDRIVDRVGPSDPKTEDIEVTTADLPSGLTGGEQMALYDDQREDAVALARLRHPERWGEPDNVFSVVDSAMRAQARR